MLTLLDRFTCLDLDLEMLREPLNTSNRDIFQADILREDGRERFRMWRGHDANRIRVLDDDAVYRQLVLLVQEPARRFEVTLDKLQWRRRPPGSELVRETPRTWTVAQMTPGVPRLYLCGVDESHLFIARVTRGDTVREAHAALKPAEVERAERRLHRRVVRQGEWFFVPPMPPELNRLRDFIRFDPTCVRRSEAVGRGGRPHVADEVVYVPAVRRPGMKLLPDEATYARGAVRQETHATVVLPTWHKVVRNLEVRGEPEREAPTVLWVD